MNEAIRELEPRSIWNNFTDLNAVPRPSKKEDSVIQFMMDFGNSLGLETFTDTVGNVIIRKPATKGMENRKTVTLQSHLDMVHQKNADIDFDFNRQGIQMFVDGDWVRAKGTTLGADNGIGVATIMALMESTDIPHPRLEALFTIDEETGMTGAMALEGDVLQGKILLNLDTEDDDEIDIGCAGGIDVTATREYNEKPIPRGIVAYRIEVNGLLGGHSGMDIHKGLGNANKIMNRLLYHCSEQYHIRISEIDGGGLRNAIPRESFAKVVVGKSQAQDLEITFKELKRDIIQEFQITEPNLQIELKKLKTSPEKVMGLGTQEKFLKGMYAAHNGVYSMNATFEGLTETSNNIAKVEVKKGRILIGCLTRSSIDSAKMNLAHMLKATFELAGCKVQFNGDYPGWQPNPNSEILKVLVKNYKNLFNEEPRVVACHAGLECGILGRNYPEMDMISYGPTIKGAHSPDERVSVSSVEKFWKFTKQILKDIPKK